MPKDKSKKSKYLKNYTYHAQKIIIKLNLVNWKLKGPIKKFELPKNSNNPKTKIQYNILFTIYILYI